MSQRHKPAEDHHLAKLADLEVDTIVDGSAARVHHILDILEAPFHRLLILISSGFSSKLTVYRLAALCLISARSQTSRPARLQYRSPASFHLKVATNSTFTVYSRCSSTHIIHRPQTARACLRLSLRERYGHARCVRIVIQCSSFSSKTPPLQVSVMSTVAASPFFSRHPLALFNYTLQVIEHNALLVARTRL